MYYFNFLTAHYYCSVLLSFVHSPEDSKDPSNNNNESNCKYNSYAYHYWYCSLQPLAAEAYWRTSSSSVPAAAAGLVACAACAQSQCYWCQFQTCLLQLGVVSRSEQWLVENYSVFEVSFITFGIIWGNMPRKTKMSR